MTARPVTTSTRRPWALRLLLIEVTLFALRGWGRAWSVVGDVERYRTLQVEPPWGWYVAANCAWGVVFTVLAAALWRRRRWALRWLWPGLSAFGLFSVGWFAAFAPGSYDQTRLPFLLVLTGLGLVINLWLIRHPKVRRTFQARQQPVGDADVNLETI